ncbi:MAG TPA: TIGR01777 family oxidoreductase [Sulfuricurvum sp.]|nr:TIGR01777 family oxidoreductase [Sulfuricurvum sp.]
MKIVLFGSSGFVGSALKTFFEQRGYETITASVRSSTSVESIVNTIENTDVLINLSGANILGRWTQEYKNILRSSRLESTQKIVNALKQSLQPPHTFINASAVGIYDGAHRHDETSYEYAHDFLATLVGDWENVAFQAQSLQTRVCATRFGVVYGKDGGAMQKMLPPFKMGLGGKMGEGSQMVSWIHIDDLVRGYDFLIHHPKISGVVNFSSPHPLTNEDQTHIMGEVLHRPTFFTIPSWAVRLIFGEGSSVMLDSKEVIPTVLEREGFVFNYPTFESAFKAITARV